MRIECNVIIKICLYFDVFIFVIIYRLCKKKIKLSWNIFLFLKFFKFWIILDVFDVG